MARNTVKGNGWGAGAPVHRDTAPVKSIPIGDFWSVAALKCIGTAVCPIENCRRSDSRGPINKCHGRFSRSVPIGHGRPWRRCGLRRTRASKLKWTLAKPASGLASGWQPSISSYSLSGTPGDCGPRPLRMNGSVRCSMGMSGPSNILAAYRWSVCTITHGRWSWVGACRPMRSLPLRPRAIPSRWRCRHDGSRAGDLSPL